jgi:uncharacterized protein (DUF433 family)
MSRLEQSAGSGRSEPANIEEMTEFGRITMDPAVMGGKPCIRGMRVTVGMIVGSIAAGQSIELLLSDYPYLQESDVREALGFAAELAKGHEAAIVKLKC